MKRYKVTVELLVSEEELDWEDKEDLDYIVGDHFYEAENEVMALDEFDCRIEINCLDHFEIEVEEE